MPPPDPEPRKDPRLRPFRAAAYGLHIALVTVFCLAMIVSVVRSVRALTPPRQPASLEVRTPRECLEAAQALWSDLEAQREKLVHVVPASQVDGVWMEFRTRWLTRKREQEARCALGSRERTRLAAVYRRLEQVLDLYTIHAVQYAGEVGGAVDALHDALEEARRDPAVGRLP